MDVLERIESQSRRASIKRPWEEETTLPGKGNAWHSALLPPLDTVPYRRPSIQRGGDVESNGSLRCPVATKESAMKRPKFEGHDYNTFPRLNTEPNGKTPPSRNPSKLGRCKVTKSYAEELTPCQYSDLIYNQSRGSLESPTSNERFTFPLKSSAPNGPNGPPNSVGPADSHDTSNLCRRCRRLTIQSRESTTVGDPDNCEDCKRNPELAWVTEECSAWLTHLAETLRSGISSEQRGIIRVS